MSGEKDDDLDGRNEGDGDDLDGGNDDGELADEEEKNSTERVAQGKRPIREIMQRAAKRRRKDTGQSSTVQESRPRTADEPRSPMRTMSAVQSSCLSATTAAITLKRMVLQTTRSWVPRYSFSMLR